MTESFCAVLLTVLVPLVTGLNLVLLRRVENLQGQIGGRRSSDLGEPRAEPDG